MATLEFVADGRAAPAVPGGLDEQPSRVPRSGLGDRALSTVSLLEWSEGTRPQKLMNCSAVSNL